MEEPTRGAPALPPRVGHVLRLAEIISEVGGIMPHGAAALAEGILEHPGFSGCHDAPAALPAQEPGEVEEVLEFLDSLAASPIFTRDCAAVRAADAAIADEALEAEFRAWWRAKVHPLTAPAYHTITTHLAWGRHLLSRGEL